MILIGRAQFVCDTRSESGLTVFQNGEVVDLFSIGKRFAWVISRDIRFRVPKESVRVLEAG